MDIPARTTCQECLQKREMNSDKNIMSREAQKNERDRIVINRIQMESESMTHTSCLYER